MYSEGYFKMMATDLTQ